MLDVLRNVGLGAGGMSLGCARYHTTMRCGRHMLKAGEECPGYDSAGNYCSDTVTYE